MIVPNLPPINPEPRMPIRILHLLWFNGLGLARPDGWLRAASHYFHCIISFPIKAITPSATPYRSQSGISHRGQQDFESLWDLFDRDGMDGETLWRTLVERNISPNKPSQMDLEELTDEIEEQRRPAAGDRLE